MHLRRENTILRDGYHYRRPSLVEESTLTRLTRKLLRMFKQQVLANTSMTVSIEYDDGGCLPTGRRGANAMIQPCAP